MPPALRVAGARLAYNASMRVRATRLAPVIVASALAVALPSLASDKKEVVLRGHVVCLDDAREPLASGKDCPDDPPGGWAIRTKDRTLHRLSSLDEDERVVMLTDLRVRSRELQIEAWQDGEGRLAIVRLRSVIDGRLHDPHFYCDVCSIRAHTPGLCWCCRAPFEFREPPVRE